MNYILQPLIVVIKILFLTTNETHLQDDTYDCQRAQNPQKHFILSRS